MDPITEELGYRTMIADKIDLWILNGRDSGPMRTLRDALGRAMQTSANARLFRPGGFGTTTAWIEQEQIVRLHDMLNRAANAA